MSDSLEWPRILFVTPLAFNHFTGGGVTFTNLFRGWPKDRLFTVHADSLALSTDTCINYFALGPGELPLAWPFEGLRRWAGCSRNIEAEEGRKQPAQAAISTSQRPALLRRLLFKISGLVFGSSGFPVEANLSDRLAKWIEAARPDVIYTILGSIEMMELVEKIRAQFDFPVVVHLMDDWRAERERYGLLSPLRRRRLNRLFNDAMRTARGHLAISDAMADAYGKEFGVAFDSIQNVIDSDAWLSLAERDHSARVPARLLYAGSLYEHVQLASLLDIALAVSRLRAAGMQISLDIMCPDFMVTVFRERLESYDGTQVVDQVPRSRYFEAIREADVLLLPVNFDNSAIRMVRYSMPTKVPEYLVSGVPVLLYGPKAIAQIDYAERAGWGYAVAERDGGALEAGIRRLVEDKPLRQKLVSQARSTAAAHHDSKKVRNAFFSALSRASKRESVLQLHCEAR
jgi:glycosyltransferase involved in cell wall biosynthesis